MYGDLIYFAAFSKTCFLHTMCMRWSSCERWLLTHSRNSEEPDKLRPGWNLTSCNPQSLPPFIGGIAIFKRYKILMLIFLQQSLFCKCVNLKSFKHKNDPLLFFMYISVYLYIHFNGRTCIFFSILMRDLCSKLRACRFTLISSTLFSLSTSCGKKYVWSMLL